ncbi:MAG: hypothetical protein OXN96_08640 [Bryobacterales bacterium]|nr:hypothetical protein [Bryobacterales bacterium]
MSTGLRAVPELESKPRTRVWWPWFIGLPTVALGLQTLLSTLEPALALLNLPFVATFNLMLWCRSAASAMLLGALIGCMHDGLNHGPVGLYGIVYTICGYLAVRFGPYFWHRRALELGLLFAAAYATHEFVYGLARSFLVTEGGETNLALGFVLTALHAGAGLFVFTMLNKADWKL